jgi:hypothetical protein
MSSKPIDFMDLDALSPALLRALRGLRFGSVEIVVHDGGSDTVQAGETTE